MNSHLAVAAVRAGGLLLLVVATVLIAVGTQMRLTGAGYASGAAAAVLIISGSHLLVADVAELRASVHRWLAAGPFLLLLICCAVCASVSFGLAFEYIDFTQLGFRHAPAPIVRVFLIVSMIGGMVGSIASIDVIAYRVRGRGIT